MVRLVEALIQRTPVEDSVGGVEEDFAGEDADGKMAGEFLHRGETGVDSDAGGVALGEGGIEQGAVESKNDGLVADTDQDRVDDVAGGRLFGGRLDLVSLGEGGRDGIKRDEEQAWNPPEDELDDKSAGKVDGVGIVSGDDAAPESFRGVGDGHGKRGSQGLQLSSGDSEIQKDSHGKRCGGSTIHDE